MRGLALLPAHSLRNGADPARTPQQAYEQADMFLFRPAVIIDVNIGPISGSVTIYFDRRAQRKERVTATFSVLEEILSPAAAREETGHGSNVCQIKTRKITECSLEPFSASIAK
jgi:hypothetical protein